MPTGILKHMKPSESVAKTLRRLGGGKMTSAQRLKAKKLKIEPTAEEKAQKEAFQTITGLADQLIQAGELWLQTDLRAGWSYALTIGI